MRTYGFIVFFLIFFTDSFAQKSVPWIIKGTVYSYDSISPLNNIVVCNFHNKPLAITELQGNFKLKLNTTDTLILRGLNIISDTIFLDRRKIFTDTLVFFILFKSYELDEIEIKKLKFVPYYEFKWKYPFNSKPATGMSPLAFLYEKTNKKYKEYGKVRALVDNDEREFLIHERLNFKKINEIITIEDSDYEPFLDFCNFSKDFIKTSNDYDIIVTVKKKFAQFKVEE
jgi:hypothetical protein